MQAQRALDRDLPISKGLIGKDLRFWRLSEIEKSAGDPLDIFGRELTVLLTQILAKRLIPVRCIDELYAPFGG